MMSTTHPAAADYLRRLERAAHILPRRDRDELISQIRDHLDSALGAGASESEVRNLLDQLGPPDDVVAAAATEGSAVPATARSRPFPALVSLEFAALAALAVSFLVTALGWLPPLPGWLLAIALVLMSRVWSWWDKGIVAVLLPIAAATAIWFTTSAHLRTGDELFLGLALSAPFAAGYLGWRLRGRSSA